MATPERESVEMVRLKNKGFTDRLRTEVFLFSERLGGQLMSGEGKSMRPLLEGLADFTSGAF